MIKFNHSKIPDILVRYILIIIFAWGPFAILYYLLTIPTIEVLTFVLKYFYEIVRVGNLVYVDGFIVEVALRCVSATAYFLLLFLVLSTAQLTVTKRLKALIIGFSTLFILNIGRMFFLIFILSNFGKYIFSIAHFMLEYFFSIYLVIGIWLGIVWVLKIKTIPIYSDVKALYRMRR